MNFDFTKTMRETSDAELIKILTQDRNDYQEAAIAAAENELTKRKLSAKQIESAKTFNSVQKAVSDEKANAPLDFHWEILSVALPGIFQLLISGILKGEGYDRKAKELTKWTFIGVLAYITLIALIIA